MKISAILVAATQAAPSSMHRWIVDNWWATAEETFNYATPNWEKFCAAVDRVSKGQIISHNSARIILVHFQHIGLFLAIILNIMIIGTLIKCLNG